LPEKCAFCVENAGKNGLKSIVLSLISFREMSNSKALQRIFLPTPPRERQTALRAASLPASTAGRVDHASRLCCNFFILPGIFLKRNILFEFLSQKMAARSGKPGARRDDFLVELIALVQKYWPQAEGPPGQL
jgi:hypothetical protein